MRSRSISVCFESLIYYFPLSECKLSCRFNCWSHHASFNVKCLYVQGEQGQAYRGGPPRGGDGAYVNGNNRWRDEEYGRGGRGGRTATAFGRQRSRHDGHDLPEWAMDDDDDRAGGAGGTFDSSGKFRAPSSESPPPPSSKAGSAPPPESKESNGKPERSLVRKPGKSVTRASSCAHDKSKVV